MYSAHILVKNQENILNQFKKSIMNSSLFGKADQGENEQDKVFIQMLNEEDLNSSLNTYVKISFAGITVN